LDLLPLLKPRTVAVVGASDDPSKLGFHVMKSLKTWSYKGKIYPINPNRTFVMDTPTFRDLAQVDDLIDLAIIVVPNKRVEWVIGQCLEKNVKSIVLITAGFKESEGKEGALLQERLKDLVGDRIPVVGPNTFGLVSYHHGLNASFTPEFSLVPPGGAAIISQSGGISHLMAFLAMEQGLGLSYVVGLGNRLNVDFEHMLYHLAEDGPTKVAGLYVEGIEEPKRLLKAIKDVSDRIPVVVMKAGKGELADKASLSHTGSLAGSQKNYRFGILQSGGFVVEDVQSFLDLLKAYEILAPPKGNRVAILSGQAGPGIVALDACEDYGLSVKPFGKKTLSEIEEIIPPMAFRSNPVDLGPLWYDQSALVEIVKKVLKDPDIDAILFLMMFASANVNSIPALLEGLLDKRPEKPIFACIVAPKDIWQKEIKEGEAKGIFCNFSTPERAAKACAGMLSLEKRRYRI